MITREDIPIGITYDAEGRELTLKNSEGFWLEYTYDAKGRVLTFKDSDGNWRECTYDAKGREMTYKNSDGNWLEYTYDDKGRVLTYKEEGFSGVGIADDGEYALIHDAEKDLFVAGCRGPFTRAEALEHWDRNDERAKLFTKAIREVA